MSTEPSPIEQLRARFQQLGTDRDQLADDPLRQFGAWLEQANQYSPGAWFEVNAATLATADRTGRVSARLILLKGFDQDGFRFFTNYRSPKARQLEQNPLAALAFYWPYLGRQVRIEGTVRKLDRNLSEAYFYQRPRESQLGAVASPQSEPLESRQDLVARVDKARRQLGEGPVPLPDYWGGYLLSPDEIEFWQGRENRLHDRFLYRRLPDGTWSVQRLAP